MPPGSRVGVAVRLSSCDSSSWLASLSIHKPLVCILLVVDLAFTALPCSSVASPGCSPSLLGTEYTILRGRGGLSRALEPTMQTQNPFLDEIAKLTTAAMGMAQTASEEAKSAFRAQADRAAAELDLIRREEFEALKAEVAALRSELDALRGRAPNA